LSNNEPLLPIPSPSRAPGRLLEQAGSLLDDDPAQPLALLQQAARDSLRQGEPRRAALLLHRRAALNVAAGHSPVEDLALAARLLHGHAEERALVLLDLGHALLQEGDTRRATLFLHSGERLARQTTNYELVAAARHTLGQVAEQEGDYASARDFLRQAGEALTFDVESDLTATLRDVGNLPADPRAGQERARRQQAIEDELEALKAELRNADPPTDPSRGTE
jgi:tetratricopeptide (TPR) repeat protein